MSRSYKKHPEYAMVVCCNGTKKDRKICNRKVRAKSKNMIRAMGTSKAITDDMLEENEPWFDFKRSYHDLMSTIDNWGNGGYYYAAGLLDDKPFPLPDEVWDKWSWAADGGPYYMESYAVAKKDWKRAVKMELNKHGWFVKSVKRIKYLIRLYKYQYKMK